MIKLRELRLDRKMSQTTLARTVGIAQGVISDIENGKCYPSYPLLERLILALECTPNDMIDLETPPMAS